MAEAIGLASGVAGLVSLTITVYGISYEYVNGVRGGSSAVLHFLREVEDLKTVLEKVEQMTRGADNQEIFGDGGSCLLSVQDANQYCTLLETIRLDLEKRRDDRSFRRRIKTLTWPFSEKKTLGLIESLHRYLEIYKTALAFDSLTVGKLTLGEMRESKVSQQDIQIETILDWLSPLNMYQVQQDTVSRRHGDTGAWLLAHPVFRRWVNSESSHRTLWCPGDPGTGKTVMTSIVVDHLVKEYSSDAIRIAYVYCNYKDQANQKASNLVACLARQLVGRPKTLPLQLEKLYKDLEPQRRRPDLEELRRLLVTLCNGRQSTYILVDALDECEAFVERRHLLPLLGSLPHGSTRLFVTSRPNSQDITHDFTNVPQINITAPPPDIQRFVAETMNERKEFMERVTPELEDQIISTISARASGMFLLAVLQIDRICIARTVKSIKSALIAMPRQLDELYRQTLKRIQNQQGEDGEYGMRILSWITHAKRPLSVEELRHGLAVTYDEDEDHDLNLENCLTVKSLVDVCGGLVIIDSQTQVIRLVHYTAQEYFEKERLRLFENAEIDISMACLTYLSYDFASASSEDVSVSEALSCHPFLAYASLHWLSHVQSTNENDRIHHVISKAKAYVKDQDKILYSTIVLRKLLLRFRKKKVHPVEAASECGLSDLLLFLLEHTTVPNAIWDSSLYYASSEGHEKVVDILILHGAKVASAIETTETVNNALHVACKGGHLGVARRLVDSGANVNLPDRWLWSPLHHAAQGGHSGLISLLLANSANPNVQTAFGLTACHVAASRGNTDTVLLLLDAGFDLKLATRDKHRTPLHSAVEGPHLEVIRLLLLRGADVSARDYNGQDALELMDSGSNTIEVKGIFAAHIEASLGKRAIDDKRTKDLSRRANDPKEEEPKSEAPESTPNSENPQSTSETAPPDMSVSSDAWVVSKYSKFFKDHGEETRQGRCTIDYEEWDERDVEDGELSEDDQEWLQSCWKKRHEAEAKGDDPQIPAVEGSKSRSWAWSAATRIFGAAISIIAETGVSDDFPDNKAGCQDRTNTSVWREAASVAGRLIYEVYGLFFAPFEFLNKLNDQAKIPITSGDNDIEQDSANGSVSSMGVYDQLPVFSPADTVDTPDLSNLSFGQVPKLRLIGPTPTPSEGSTPIVQAEAASDEDVDAIQIVE